MLIDVKKAFLYGSVNRRVYIRLPEEDEKGERGKMFGPTQEGHVWCS